MCDHALLVLFYSLEGQVLRQTLLLLLIMAVTRLLLLAAS